MRDDDIRPVACGKRFDRKLCLIFAGQLQLVVVSVLLFFINNSNIRLNCARQHSSLGMARSFLFLGQSIRAEKIKRTQIIKEMIPTNLLDCSLIRRILMRTLLLRSNFADGVLLIRATSCGNRDYIIQTWTEIVFDEWLR